MDLVLWIAQAVLALAFLAAGAMKLTRPQAKLAGQMPWVEDFSPGQVRVIGLVEVLAAVGLIVPALTGILPLLTPLAAVGLALLMIGAAATHLPRDERSALLVKAVLLVLAAGIAWGRFGPVPL
jgi:uncharacterized membrane protein YphA (DoxX/SURF4 family)